MYTKEYYFYWISAIQVLLKFIDKNIQTIQSRLSDHSFNNNITLDDITNTTTYHL